MKYFLPLFFAIIVISPVVAQEKSLDEIKAMNRTDIIEEAIVQLTPEVAAKIKAFDSVYVGQNENSVMVYFSISNRYIPLKSQHIYGVTVRFQLGKTPFVHYEKYANPKNFAVAKAEVFVASTEMYEIMEHVRNVLEEEADMYFENGKLPEGDIMYLYEGDSYIAVEIYSSEWTYKVHVSKTSSLISNEINETVESVDLLDNGPSDMDYEEIEE